MLLVLIPFFNCINDNFQMRRIKYKKRFYLDVREEGFQHIGAGVAGVEEHELGLLQMAGGEALLDVYV